MVSIYSNHGKHKRIAKLKRWATSVEYLKKRFGKDPDNPELKNYFAKTTKS